MIFYHFCMTGKRLNKLLNINAKHALYRKDGKWYQLLNDFPGVLFDDNGLVIFNSKEEYDNQKELDCKKTIHIKDGISSLAEYTYFSPIQLDILEQNDFYNSYAELVFTPSDIVWFKSVTNEEIGEAYMNVKNIFPLNFPTKFKENAKTPKCGEIIVLYQKISGTPALTHLVTPIDNNIKDQNIRDEYRYTRQVKIIAQTTRTDLIKVSNTSFNDIKKGGITQGNVCKLEHVSKINNLSKIQIDTWQRFSPYFIYSQRKNVNLTQRILNDLETDPYYSAEEGKLLLASHYIKERHKRIVIEKKKQAIKKNKLICEVCHFSFRNTFGADFIECHHLMPIGKTGQRITTLDDLALVCANCHRMLHAKFNGEYLSSKELKLLIKKQNQNVDN